MCPTASVCGIPTVLNGNGLPQPVWGISGSGLPASGDVNRGNVAGPNVVSMLVPDKKVLP